MPRTDAITEEPSPAPSGPGYFVDASLSPAVGDLGATTGSPQIKPSGAEHVYEHWQHGRQLGIAIVSGGVADCLSSVFAAGPIVHRQETARLRIQARERLYLVVTSYDARLRTSMTRTARTRLVTRISPGASSSPKRKWPRFRTCRNESGNQAPTPREPV